MDKQAYQRFRGYVLLQLLNTNPKKIEIMISLFIRLIKDPTTKAHSRTGRARSCRYQKAEEWICQPEGPILSVNTRGRSRVRACLCLCRPSSDPVRARPAQTQGMLLCKRRAPRLLTRLPLLPRLSLPPHLPPPPLLLSSISFKSSVQAFTSLQTTIHRPSPILFLPRSTFLLSRPSISLATKNTLFDRLVLAW